MKTQLRQARQARATGSLFSVLQRTRAGSSSAWAAMISRLSPLLLHRLRVRRLRLQAAPSSGGESGAEAMVRVVAERASRLVGAFRLSGCNAAGADVHPGR